MYKLLAHAILSFGFFLPIQSSFGTDYILFLRARGTLGSELRTYWNTVLKDPDIRHAAITDYPPHCSLTGFFPKDQSKDEYIQAVEDALDEVSGIPRTVTVNRLVQGKKYARLDYIQLTSPYALRVTKAFMDNADVPKKYLKDPSNFTYHITLRDHIFQQNVTQKMTKIQSLENRIHLNTPVSWSLFLYERDSDGDLTMIKEFPL